LGVLIEFDLTRSNRLILIDGENKPKSINIVSIVALPENRRRLPKTDVKIFPNRPKFPKIDRIHLIIAVDGM
jgi:hypothetical protein